MISKSKRNLLLIIAAFVVIAVFITIKLLDNHFRYAGTLEVTKVDLAARLPASIDEVRVYEGASVTKNQALITLNCEDFKTAARLAQDEYARNEKLVKNNFISASTLDQYKTKMDDANTKVNWCTIASPIDGKVLSRNHEPGEWMEPGTSILTLGNIRDIWAYIYVPQPLIAKLSFGMKLKGYLPELKDQEFDGEIIAISDEAEFTPKNVQTQKERERLIYRVKVSFLKSNANEILKPGMTIEIVLPK
jgi:HlyD family secretion protein